MSKELTGTEKLLLLVSLNLVFRFLDFNCIAMEKKQTKKTKKTEAETPTEAIAFP